MSSEASKKNLFILFLEWVALTNHTLCKIFKSSEFSQQNVCNKPFSKYKELQLL
jgi:hypothetical protein